MAASALNVGPSEAIQAPAILQGWPEPARRLPPVSLNKSKRLIPGLGLAAKP